MAGASDKARFYLERSVSDLRDWEQKKIFSTEEVRSIASKLSDFEHKLNARGSTPLDYIRYVDYEVNLDALRRKRVQRLGIKMANHMAQRRIFSLFDRGTRKFHGDIKLWLRFIEYARREQANRKLAKIFADVLRLHPTKPDLWVRAARWSVDTQADMTAARSYMQRSLRFCPKTRELWLEYAKLEMSYVAKVTARRQVLSLDEPKPEEAEGTAAEGDGGDEIAVPELTNAEVDISRNTYESSLRLPTSPALQGKIALAIFDDATAKFDRDNILSERFFDLFATYSALPSSSHLIQHVLERMQETSPKSAGTLFCFVKQTVVGLAPHDPQFFLSFGRCLRRVNEAFSITNEASQLASRIVDWLSSFLQLQDLDDDVLKILDFSIQLPLQKYLEGIDEGDIAEPAECAKLIARFRLVGRETEASRLLQGASERWFDSMALQSLAGES